MKNLGGGLAEIASTEGRAKSLAADAKGPKVLAGRAGQAELSHPVVFDKAGRPLVRITLDGRRSDGGRPQGPRAHRGRRGARIQRDVPRGRDRGLRARRLARRDREVEGHPRGRAVEPDVHGRRRRADRGPRPASHQPAARRRQRPRHHDRRDVGQLRLRRRATDGGRRHRVRATCRARAIRSATRRRSPCSRRATPATPTKAARYCRSCTTSRRRRGSASPPPTAARSTSRTTSARSAASPTRRTREPGFKADIIVDDVIYPTEPMFQDGVVAQAVDDVAAAGISHFSSAGNRSGSESYDSAVRIVPGRAQSWANTNLDFSGVDPALYAGGFHDFDAGSARDIAQTIQSDDGSLIVFQWNEPFDPQPPTVVQVIAEGTGTVPDGGDTVVTFDGEAGQLVEIFVDGDENGPGVGEPGRHLRPVRPERQLHPVRRQHDEPGVADARVAGDRHVLRARRQLHRGPVRRLPVPRLGSRGRRAGAVRLQPAVLPRGRHVHRQLRRAEPVLEPAARGRRAAGRDAAARDRAREHAAEEQPERRGPHPLRRLQTACARRSTSAT